jgi:MoaA/NifB/PqqE/SkfB family radical SAM enzyme
MSFARNYVANLLALVTGREPLRPLLFSYYVTHRCPLSCAYCGDGQGRPFNENPVPELSTGDATSLVSILARSADTLDITGGEPMLRDDLEDILAHARASGMRTILNTKGMGLAGRPGLMRHTSVLVIGVDSLDPGRLSRICGCTERGACGILDGLEHALGARTATRTQLVISAVATPGNLGDVSSILKFSVRHGIGFHLSPEIHGMTPNPALRANMEYDSLIHEVQAAKRAGHAVLGVDGYLTGIREFRQYRCHPLLMPVIRPDGCLAYPCLESQAARIGIAAAGGYPEALRAAMASGGPVPDCGDRCQIFCHMGLSLLQRRPAEAIREGRSWRAIRTCSAPRRTQAMPEGSSA